MKSILLLALSFLMFSCGDTADNSENNSINNLTTNNGNKSPEFLQIEKGKKLFAILISKSSF